jgi:hypothetical protein
LDKKSENTKNLMSSSASSDVSVSLTRSTASDGTQNELDTVLGTFVAQEALRMNLNEEKKTRSVRSRLVTSDKKLKEFKELNIEEQKYMKEMVSKLKKECEKSTEYKLELFYAAAPTGKAGKLAPTDVAKSKTLNKKSVKVTLFYNNK